jgi:hypothetical protein
VEPFAGKVVLEWTNDVPLCPACERPLARVCWHKIRGGPAVLPYTVVLSCGGCLTLLDVLTGGGDSGAAMA